MSYGEFEEALKSAEGYGRIRVLLDGIMHNLFYRGVREVNSYNLGTLKIRYPEIYETIGDENVRKALIFAEMFVLDPFKGPGIEITIDERDRHLSDFIDGWHLWITLCHPYIGRARYVGEDAVKVFLKSTFLLSSTLHEVLYYPVLADPWRCKQGLEDDRDELKSTVVTYMRELMRETSSEIPNTSPYHKPEKASDSIAYSLWYYYHNIGNRVKGKVERMLNINLSDH
jgi:hypothetical protein